MALCTYITAFACLHLHCFQMWLQKIYSPMHHAIDLVTLFHPLVDRPMTGLHRGSLSPHFPGQDNHHQLIPHKLGSAYGQSHDTGNMDSLGIQDAHQHFGTQGYKEGMPRISPVHQFPLCSYVGQHLQCLLCQLCSNAVNLWNWCITHQILLSAFYLPGTQHDCRLAQQAVCD